MTLRNDSNGVRIPVGLDSWAKCWRCGGYLVQTGEDARQRYARCEGCGEPTTLYHRRRAALPGERS